MYVYLDEFRWAKTSNPHKASLSRSLPHTRKNVKNIGFHNQALAMHQIIKMGDAIVYIEADLIIRQVLFNSILKPAHVKSVVV